MPQANAPVHAIDSSAAAREARVQLAAAFRLAVHFDWHEGVGNHFSLAVSADGRRFLMNPRWRHFARIRASDLQLLDADDPQVMSRPDAPDETAWCIHGRIHAALPQARCVLHLHPPYATALAALADPVILPIDQNTARFHARVAYDGGFSGMVTSASEGDRLAALLGARKVMLLGNHGALVAAPTVAEAFDLMYFLERACRTQVLALSTGRPLAVMSEALAERTAQDWEDYTAKEFAFAHFDELRRLLDAREPDYAD